ncbi:MAG: phosphatidylglycerophosphatase A [Rhodospirillaceae bacterium]|nr:phosphatidylglycerophosphatase A [Rhodospirillaceae bacterium]
MNVSKKSPPKLPESLPFSHPAALIATWFGTGLISKFPGALASLATLPCAWLIMRDFGLNGLLIFVITAFAAGLWASNVMVQEIGDEGADPGMVVIDEVAGQALTLCVVPPDLMLYFVGFVLFRLFDILKPWPISLCEARIKGGLGIMVDDIVAGIFAAICLSIYFFVYQWFISAF